MFCVCNKNYAKHGLKLRLKLGFAYATVGSTKVWLLLRSNSGPFDIGRVTYTHVNDNFLRSHVQNNAMYNIFRSPAKLLDYSPECNFSIQHSICAHFACTERTSQSAKKNLAVVA